MRRRQSSSRLKSRWRTALGSRTESRNVSAACPECPSNGHCLTKMLTDDKINRRFNCRTKREAVSNLERLVAEHHRPGDRGSFAPPADGAPESDNAGTSPSYDQWQSLSGTPRRVAVGCRSEQRHRSAV